MSNSEFALFVPVYNEEKILAKNVDTIKNECETLGIPFEIIIVDDASTDKTGSIAEHLAANSSQGKERSKGVVRVVHFENGPSRRENLAESFRRTTASIIGFVDADLAPEVTFLKKLVHETKENDICIGSRYSGIKADREVTRLVISKCYNFMVRLVFASRVRDHQCGLKVFRKESLFSLLDEMGYDKTFRRGWFWDAELLIRAQKKNLKIAEVAVPWHRGEKSTFSVKRELKLIRYMFELKQRLSSSSLDQDKEKK